LERHRKVSSLSSFSLSLMRHMRVQPFRYRREGREIMPEQTRIALDGEGFRRRLQVGLRRNAMHACFP
jgi:hypothetical protein